MFPFAMQARLLEAWLEASAAGFAVAGSMGATAARNLEMWTPGVRRREAFGGLGPWSWLIDLGAASPSSWWQFPFSFYTPSAMWLASPLRWQAALPLMPFTPVWPLLPAIPGSAGAALFSASYRTASGHATATMFEALLPGPANWRAAPWQLSPMWGFMR